MKDKKIELLNNCIVRLGSWNRSVGFRSPEGLSEWSGTIRIPVKYPFEKESVIEIEKKKDDYWSTEDLISAVKKRLKYMYSQSKSREMKNLYNDEWNGGYGVAYHSLDELWLEYMTFDPDTGEVDVFIGS